MAQDRWELFGSEPETRLDLLFFVGGTTSAAAKVYGKGMSMAWTSTGIYTVTWSEYPGLWMGATWGLAATTASTVKGFTVVMTTPAVVGSGPTWSATINVTSAAEALVDLTAAQWCTLHMGFKRTSA